MKNITLTLLALTSPATLANAYIGVGIQTNSATLQEDEFKNPTIGQRTFDLGGANTEANAHLFTGYRFSNNFGVELGYTSFEQSDDYEQSISFTEEEEEYEANLDVVMHYAVIFMH